MPAMQVDVEVVGEPAGRGELGRRLPDAAGERDDPDVAACERLARECDVVGRRPAPVEVREPEVDRVEAAAGDRREQVVEAGGEGLERLEGRVRGGVERPPLVGGAVAELLGDVVGAHERESEGSCRVHVVSSPLHVVVVVDELQRHRRSRPRRTLRGVSSHFEVSCGTQVRSIRVYGCTGFAKTLGVGPISTIRPRCRMTTRSEM